MRSHLALSAVCLLGLIAHSSAQSAWQRVGVRFTMPITDSEYMLRRWGEGADEIDRDKSTTQALVAILNTQLPFLEFVPMSDEETYRLIITLQEAPGTGDSDAGAPAPPADGSLPNPDLTPKALQITLMPGSRELTAPWLLPPPEELLDLTGDAAKSEITKTFKVRLEGNDRNALVALLSNIDLIKGHPQSLTCLAYTPSVGDGIGPDHDYLEPYLQPVIALPLFADDFRATPAKLRLGLRVRGFVGRKSFNIETEHLNVFDFLTDVDPEWLEEDLGLTEASDLHRARWWWEHALQNADVPYFVDAASVESRLLVKPVVGEDDATDRLEDVFSGHPSPRANKHGGTGGGIRVRSLSIKGWEPNALRRPDGDNSLDQRFEQIRKDIELFETLLFPSVADAP